MTKHWEIPSNNISFKNYLIRVRSNRITLYISAATIIVQFVIFKYLYPYASYIHGDSFSYLEAASKNLDINTYLIGYSKLLRFASVFTSSDTALVTVQYLFIQTSALLLLFTIFYFYKLSKVTRYLLIAFMVFNPLFYHLGNLISSDGYFLGLSLLWACLLLWIINRPNMKIVIYHAIVLFTAFTVRYNALIYPIIAAVAFQFSPLSLKNKIIGIGLSILLCGLFVTYTSYKYKNLTGYWQYSPFSGWQLTNNAMYIYRYVNKDQRKSVPQKFRAFDNMVRQYFDSTRDTNKFPLEKIDASTFYMWTPHLPMVKYQDILFKKDSTAIELKKWASMGPLYKSYGLYIIRQYPFHFIKHFILPNGSKYYAPPLEFLKSYNSSRDYVTSQAKEWFEYKSQKIKTRMKNNNVWVLGFYPILTGIINIVMFFLLLFYLAIKGWQNNPATRNVIILFATIWLLNAVFTIVASSAALRFQSFPIILTSTFTFFLIDWLWNLAMKSEGTKIPAIIKDTNRDISVNIST